MPQPKSVTIAGTDIEEVQEVRVTIDTPINPRGHYDGRTGSMEVKLIRRARNTPTSEMFKFATNGDGRLKLIDGTIVLQDSELKDTYTIKMKQAYIDSWEFHQPPEDDDLVETISLQVGQFEIAGGGGNVAYTMPDFIRK